LVAPVAPEACEIIIERTKTVVLPMKLQAMSSQEADFLQGVDFVVEAEIYVHGRDLVLRGDGRQRLSQQTNQSWSILPARNQEASPRDGSKRNTHEHLWIVADAQTLRGFGPLIVENEFPHAVQF